jgi:hypothetical protein
MKQRAVAIVADYMSRRPLGRVVGLKSIADDDYVLAIEDIRDGRVHVVRTPSDLGRGSSRSRRVSASSRRSASVAGATRSTRTETSMARTSAPASVVRPNSSRSR